MSVEVRTPTLEDWPAICAADARAFGSTMTPEDVEDRLKMHDIGRFRIALDKGQIVGVAASYAMDVSLPGGAIVPMGGVTWVSTAATHRRQGLMRRVVGAVHDDIDARGEPVATLYAAEGGIYEHVGYGIATRTVVNSIDTRLARMRDEYRAAPGAVRYVDVDGDDVVPVVTALWDPLPDPAGGRDRTDARGAAVPVRAAEEGVSRVAARSRTSCTPTATRRTESKGAGATGRPRATSCTSSSSRP